MITKTKLCKISLIQLIILIMMTTNSCTTEKQSDSGKDYQLTSTLEILLTSKKGDTDLATFSIAPDKQGFDPAEHPGIKDANYDLLPMI